MEATAAAKVMVTMAALEEGAMLIPQVLVVLAPLVKVMTVATAISRRACFRLLAEAGEPVPLVATGRPTTTGA